MTFNDSKRNTYAGVLGSKAVGEQAMMMGVSVIFALRRAIDSVRRDLGQSPLPFYTLGNVWKSVKKRVRFWHQMLFFIFQMDPPLQRKFKMLLPPQQNTLLFDHFLTLENWSRIFNIWLIFHMNFNKSLNFLQLPLNA